MKGLTASPSAPGTPSVEGVGGAELAEGWENFDQVQVTMSQGGGSFYKSNPDALCPLQGAPKMSPWAPSAASCAAASSQACSGAAASSQQPPAVAGGSWKAAATDVCTFATDDTPYTAAYFKNYAVTSHYSAHNEALKNFRHNQEQQGPPYCAEILKPEPYELKIVVHPNKGGPCGFEFHFGEGRFRWCWKELVASFRDCDIDFLCDGVLSGGLAPLVRSGGLVACFISPKPNSYDMKRHRADAMTSKRDNTARQFGSRLPEWDFVLVRADGSQVRLHPSFTTTKVACFAAEGHHCPVEVPGGDLGGSDGPGCFRRVINEGKICELRFLPSKRRSSGA